VSFRSELPYTDQLDAIRHLDRLFTTLARYLTDLPPQPGRIYGPLRDGIQPALAAVLALDRTAQSLRPAAAGAADADTAPAHPAVAHLSAAADHLAAGRDLLHTHFITDPAGTTTACSYWAPLITSGPVTSALLASLADDLHTLAPWIATQARTRRANPGALTVAHLALRGARPWLEAAATAIEATQRAHYPLPASRLLDAIPVNAPPPALPWRAGPRTVPADPDDRRTAPLRRLHLRAACPLVTRSHLCRLAPRRPRLCHHHPRLRAHPAHARRTRPPTRPRTGLPAATPPRSRAHEPNLDLLARRHRPLGHPDHRAHTHTSHHPRRRRNQRPRQQTGQLAYANPHWTPACARTSQIRAPASLACSPADITVDLGAVHHAADAISRITALDHQAVTDAATDHRLYIPTRLLSDKYDIPRPTRRHQPHIPKHS
jgi:hypothetical protein